MLNSCRAVFLSGVLVILFAGGVAACINDPKSVISERSSSPTTRQITSNQSSSLRSL